MNNQLESKAFSLAGLFAPPFCLVSPAFQRPFAWDTDDAERLLSDIQSALGDAPMEIYFMGAILLVRVPKPGDATAIAPQGSNFEGPEREFEIIDGQQRIVTTTILLAVLRDLTGRQASGLYERLQVACVATGTRDARVQLRGADYTFLSHCIGEPGACLVPPLVGPSTDPQTRLLAIRDHFVQQLKPLDRSELIALATFILDRCSIVAVVTNAIDRAFQMFTVLNDTGKPLSRNDILKAELIGQTPLADRPRVTEIWDDLADRLGVDFEQLFSFMRTQSGRGSGPVIEMIRAKVAATPGGAAAYVTETLAPAGRLVDVILRARHEGAPQSPEINRILRYLGWLQGKEWVPPLLAYWQLHGTDAAALLTFLHALDRCAFGLRLLGLGSDKRTRRMTALTVFVNSGAPKTGPWPPLQFSREEIRTLSFSLKDLYRRSQPTCRLVLMRLDERLSGRAFTGQEGYTVEHILPLKSPANSRWRIDFPDGDVRQALATCLGNLTLVTQSINERAGNHDYERKREIYFGPDNGDAVPITRLTEELRSVPVWTPKQIEERYARLTRLFNEIWDLA